MDLADKVRKRRIELSLSQDELARRMGYSSRSSINKIEKGRPCSQKVIARLANVLDVSISYLMGWDEEIQSNPVGTAERHVEILMDEDISEIFDYFQKMDKRKRQIVEDLAKTLAEAEA